MYLFLEMGFRFTQSGVTVTLDSFLDRLSQNWNFCDVALKWSFLDTPGSWNQFFNENSVDVVLC